MTTFDLDLIGEAVRLFEGRALSGVEARKLRGEVDSRQDLLEELWFRRGALARFPELVAAIGRAQTSAVTATDSGERAFYESMLGRLDPAEPTAIYVPRWRGVATSTRHLFQQTIPIPPTASHHPAEIGPAKVAFYAKILLSSRIRHFVVSGGDAFHISLIESVLQQDADIRFDLLWHSGYLQMGELHDWTRLREWLRAVEAGTVTRVGVVKSGLDAFLRQFGVDAVFIPNFVPIDLDGLRATEIADVVGIWLSGSSSYRKLPQAMIAAVKAMRSFYLKGAGLGEDGLALVSTLDIPFLQVWQDPIPHRRLLREIQQTAVSLYVTISECSPMLPLESFALGVPCLVGPSSHLFRDHGLLREMLVVPQPYNPGLIADMAIAAVARRHDLIVSYTDYIREEEARAHAALTRFLA